MSKSEESLALPSLTIKEQWLAAISPPKGPRASSHAASGESPGVESGNQVFPADKPDELSELQAAGLVLEVPIRPQLPEVRPAVSFVQAFPISFAREHAVLACLGEDGELEMLMPGERGWPLLDIARRVLRKPLSPVFARRDEILKAINQAYEQQSAQPDAVLGTLSQDDAAAKLQAFQERDDLLATAGQAPVVELVNLVLLDAVKAGASDVHFQPYREKLIIRFRIDGILFDAHRLPKGIQEEALSRIKVMGKMNIAEKRLPQDGRATVTVGDRLIDLRIASLPGNYGERIVLRILDKSTRNFNLSEVGLGEENCRRFRELIGLEHGLILLTGPTGSGKTTTLYAALAEINSCDRNVVTLEDPIEYEIDGISQTQINVKKGMTFVLSPVENGGASRWKIRVKMAAHMRAVR